MDTLKSHHIKNKDISAIAGPSKYPQVADNNLATLSTE